MQCLQLQQPMPVKTEMVKVPETKETKCETKVPVMPQSQMMCTSSSNASTSNVPNTNAMLPNACTL